MTPFSAFVLRLAALRRGLLFVAHHRLDDRKGVSAFGVDRCAAHPAFISEAVYWFDPDMQRYAVLSALNLGVLHLLAARGWTGDLRD